VTQRKPIVIVDGRQQQIQSGDTLGGISAAVSSGEAMVYDQFGANASQMTPTGDPTFDAITGTSDATINSHTIGQGAFASVTNLAVGSNALGANVSGTAQTAIGESAFFSAQSASAGVAIGTRSAYSNVDAAGMVAIGERSFYNSTLGEMGTAVGYRAAQYQADGVTPYLGGQFGVYIGSNTKGYGNSDSYAIVIGADAVGESNNSIVIGTANNATSHIFGKPTFGSSTTAFTFNNASLTAARTITIPDAAGTMTLLGNASTGSGSVVLATSPTLTTPNIGAATATTVNGVSITGSGTLATGSGNTLTLSGTSSINQNVTTTGSPTWAGGTFRQDQNGLTQTLHYNDTNDTAARAGMQITSRNASGTFSGLFAAYSSSYSAATLGADIPGNFSFVTSGNGTPSILFAARNSAGSISFYTNASGSVSSTTLAMTINSSRNIGVGTASPSARIHAISTTEQLRLGYDSSNYATITVASNGATTFDAVGAGAAFTFSDNVSSTGSITSTGTGGVGYATGAGGTVTQSGSRSSSVVINKTTGAITLVSAAGSATWQTFTVTNSTVAATDVIVVNQKSGTDLYMTHVTNVAAGSFKISFATTGGTTTEQPVFNFAVIKGVTA
jgi:hypothetical protein